MTDSHQDQSPQVQPVGERLTWTAHPVKRRPLISAAVTIFVVMVVVVVYYTTMSRTFAILAMVVLLASLAKFYFPTTYIMDAEGLTIGSTSQKIKKEWSQFRSCYPDKNGILLSPFPSPSRLESFRGVFVMFEGNSEQVTAFARRYIGANANTQSEETNEDRATEA